MIGIINVRRERFFPVWSAPIEDNLFFLFNIFFYEFIELWNHIEFDFLSFMDRNERM